MPLCWAVLGCAAGLCCWAVLGCAAGLCCWAVLLCCWAVLLGCAAGLLGCAAGLCSIFLCFVANKCFTDQFISCTISASNQPHPEA